MKTLISLDPGVSTGLVVGTYSDTEPFKLTHAFQIGGGLMGFRERVYLLDDGDYGGGEFYGFQVNPENWKPMSQNPLYSTSEEDDVAVICEKFVPRQALKLAAAEPLRIEGMLVDRGVMPDYIVGKKNLLWPSPALQYFNGGKNKAEKKKRQHAWLKANGFVIMPKDVGAPDADDARSACAHAISWLRRQKHEPTMKHYFKEPK